MNDSLFSQTDSTIISLILFSACIFMVRLGRFVRNKFFNKDKEESRGGVNSLLAALFGLWGFVLAFTFGNSSSRFDSVSNTMVDEFNTIRNVIYRSKLFPDSIGDSFRKDMKIYIGSRIDYYKYAGDNDKVGKTIEDTRRTAKSLWAKTEYVSTLPNMGISAANMFASLTTMYDLAAKRDTMLLQGVPVPIFYLLFFLALVISFIGGFTTPVIGTKEWVIISGFILLACIIIFITLDLSRPMTGFIRPNVAEERIEQLPKLFLDSSE